MDGTSAISHYIEVHVIIHNHSVIPSVIAIILQ